MPSSLELGLLLLLLLLFFDTRHKLWTEGSPESFPNMRSITTGPEFNLPHTLSGCCSRSFADSAEELLGLLILAAAAHLLDYAPELIDQVLAVVIG